MVTRSTQILAFAMLFVSPHLYAMEEESESHKHYNVTLSDDYRDDYEQLHHDFYEEEKSLDDFVKTYPDKLKQHSESLAYFRRIQSLVQANDGKEQIVETSGRKVISLDLSFQNPVPISALSNDSPIGTTVVVKKVWGIDRYDRSLYPPHEMHSRMSKIPWAGTW